MAAEEAAADAVEEVAAAVAAAGGEAEAAVALEAAALEAAGEAVVAAASRAPTDPALRADGGLRPTTTEATAGVNTGARTKVAGDSGEVPERATGSRSPNIQECQRHHYWLCILCKKITILKCRRVFYTMCCK